MFLRGVFARPGRVSAGPVSGISNWIIGNTRESFECEECVIVCIMGGIEVGDPYP